MTVHTKIPHEQEGQAHQRKPNNETVFKTQTALCALASRPRYDEFSCGGF